MLEKQEKETAFQRLEKLVGLHQVKETIEQLRRIMHLKEMTEPGYYIFAGNPGTGKTTVARIFGDILREEGVLKRGHVVEVLREDLVAGFVGQTAQKTKEKLQEALDGIFFLDEAYSLVHGGQNDFGQEAINTILAFMENNRARICVIFAGYTKNMEGFIQSNPGLTRRISETIVFEDYNTDDMVYILKNFAGDFVLEPEYIQKSRQVFDFWIKNKTRNFGNAGQVRNYFAECKDALYERIYKEYESDIPEEVKKTLTGQDIPSKYLHIVGVEQMGEMVEKCPVCKTECSNGATLCSVCGFSDELGINRTWPIKEDFDDWLEAVVKQYRVRWEAKKKEAELLARITELEAKLSIPSAPDQKVGFTDPRDGKCYKTVKIGGQVWMAENLNYAAKGSKCYNNEEANGAKYGRLYNWKTAKKACPVGWHLPSDEEWRTLVNYVGGKDIAGKKLKSKIGWNNNGNGIDEYGFSALPGGCGDGAYLFYIPILCCDSFNDAGNYGLWWSSSSTSVVDNFVGYLSMRYDYEHVNMGIYNKSYMFSVRCVQD